MEILCQVLRMFQILESFGRKINVIIKLDWAIFQNLFHISIYAQLGKPPSTNNAVLFNIVKWPLTPPLVLNIYVADSFEGLLKGCLNVCHNKIRQNIA